VNPLKIRLQVKFLLFKIFIVKFLGLESALDCVNRAKESEERTLFTQIISNLQLKNLQLSAEISGLRYDLKQSRELPKALNLREEIIEKIKEVNPNAKLLWINLSEGNLNESSFGQLRDSLKNAAPGLGKLILTCGVDSIEEIPLETLVKTLDDIKAKAEWQ